MNRVKPFRYKHVICKHNLNERKYIYIFYISFNSFQKKNRDNKRSWMTLASLPQDEFQIIENQDLKASRIYNMLKNVTKQDKRIKLLENLAAPTRTRTSKVTQI